MDVSALIEGLGHVTTNPSITDAEKILLHSACINAASMLEPFEKKLLDLLFAVRDPNDVTSHSNYYNTAFAIGRSSCRDRHAPLRCMCSLGK